MPEVTETQLPGVGIRHEFTTIEGERVGVVAHRNGRREIVVYERSDPDTCHSVLHLSPDDTQTLAELLGAPQVTAAAAVQHRVQGLEIDWLTLPEGSPLVGSTIGEGQLRTRTGVSIVAVMRGEETEAAPTPGYEFAAGDVAVAVGTPEGLQQLRQLIRG